MTAEAYIQDYEKERRLAPGQPGAALSSFPPRWGHLGNGDSVERGEAMNKPQYGAECNGCGLCCRSEPCGLGAHVFQQSAGECPALGVNDDGRSFCGLAASPGYFAPQLALMHGAAALTRATAVLVGVGVGCDSFFDDEQPVQGYEERRERLLADAEFRATVNDAAEIWGMESPLGVTP